MSKFTQMLLLEISLKDHFEKFIAKKYPDLRYEIYNMIADLDPTGRNDQRGKYVEWLIKALEPLKKSFKTSGEPWFTVLLKLTQGHPYNINKDDLHKALGRYDKYPKKEDINKFTNIQDFVIYVKNLPPTGKEEKEKDKEIFNDKQNIYIIDVTDEWIVAQPLTHEGSIKLARYKSPQSAKWCTADPTSDSHCKSYNDRGVLVNFLNRKDSMWKVQFFLDTGNLRVGEVKNFYNEDISAREQQELEELSDRVIEFFDKKLGLTEYINSISEESFKNRFNTTIDTIEKFSERLTDEMVAHITSVYSKYMMEGISTWDKEGLATFYVSKHSSKMEEFLTEEATRAVEGKIFENPDKLFNLIYTEVPDVVSVPSTGVEVDEIDQILIQGYKQSSFMSENQKLIKEKMNNAIDRLFVYADENSFYIDTNHAKVFMYLAETTFDKYIKGRVNTHNDGLRNKVADVAIKTTTREDIEKCDETNWQEPNSAVLPLYHRIYHLDKDTPVDVKKLYTLLIPKNSDYFEVREPKNKSNRYYDSPFTMMYPIKILTSVMWILYLNDEKVFDNYPSAKTHIKKMFVPLYEEIYQLLDNNVDANIIINENMSLTRMVVEAVGKQTQFWDMLKRKTTSMYNELNDTKRINSLGSDERVHAVHAMGKRVTDLLKWSTEMRKEMMGDAANE
jgi:hypothetical protein